MAKTKKLPKTLLSEAHPDLVADGRCGRWRRDGPRTKVGGVTRKQEALSTLLERGKKKTVPQQRVIALSLRDDYLEARCTQKVDKKGRPVKQYFFPI